MSQLPNPKDFSDFSSCGPLGCFWLVWPSLPLENSVLPNFPRQRLLSKFFYHWPQHPASCPTPLPPYSWCWCCSELWPSPIPFSPHTWSLSNLISPVALIIVCKVVIWLNVSGQGLSSELQTQIKKRKTSQQSHFTRHLQFMVTIRQFFLPPIIPVLMTNATLCSFSQLGNREAILNFCVHMICQDEKLPKFYNFLPPYFSNPALSLYSHCRLP